MARQQRYFRIDHLNQPAAVARAPRTRYTKRGDMDIAYQVLGHGPTNLLVLPLPLVDRR
jgi:hypothetical protein